MKSPINYEDSHLCCTMALKRLIPSGSLINSFLFYSGELEFSLSSAKRFVNSHTNNHVIYEFWYCMQKDPRRIIEIINSNSFQSFNNEKSFNILQETWSSCRDPYMRAALFLFLSWASDTGLVSSGRFEKLTHNPYRINKVSEFKPRNFHLSLVDPSISLLESIAAKNNANYTLLPMGKFSYNLFDEGKNIGIEQTTINHVDFYDFIKNFSQKCILLYKNHDWVHKTYENFNITMVDKQGNSASQNNCEDIIVTNF
tara:strand:+ start:389 stop:1156 length:768 start_codon:yes stop_codon:yes gene_type:complete